MRRIEKIVQYAGVLLVIAAILCNPVFLGYVFAPDKTITSLPLIAHILLWEIVFLLFGIFFYRKSGWAVLHMKQLFLSFFALFVLWAIFEITLRLTEQRIVVPLNAAYHYKYVPNTKIIHAIPDGKTFYKQTNSDGFVDTEFVGKSPIFLLGDSYAACFQAEDCVHEILEKELHVPVFNFGVGGYGILHELGILEEYKHLRPSLVLLFFLPQNDLLENERYLYAEKALFAQGNEKRGLRFFAWYREKMEKVLRNFLSISSRLKKQLHAEKTVENYEVYLNVYDSVWEKRWQAECEAVTAIARLTASLNATLVLITVTGSEQVYPSVWKELQDIYPVLQEHTYNLSKPNALMAECAEKLGISHLDLLPPFKRNPAMLHYPIDGHWNAKGQRFAAEKIVEFLTANNSRIFINSSVPPKRDE